MENVHDDTDITPNVTILKHGKICKVNIYRHLRFRIFAVMKFPLKYGTSEILFGV